MKFLTVKRYLATLGLCGCIATSLCACTSATPSISVKGMIAEQRVETTVDAETARYYLEHYLTDSRTDPKLDKEIDRLHRMEIKTLPDRHLLKSISNRFSPDFAALYLMHYLANIETNRRMLELFYAEIKRTRQKIKSGGFRLDPRVSSYFFLFAPGWRYKTYPDTGADFAKIRSILNGFRIETHLIQTQESGAVEHNATIIADEIAHYAKHHEKIILVSTSKSGAEAALAISYLTKNGRGQHLSAWVNIGGLLKGSKLADNTLAGPRGWWARTYFWFRGWDIAGLESLTTVRSRMRFEQFQFPKDLWIINYIGIPLSGYVSASLWDDYQTLNKDGPNDCRMLIIDGIVPGSTTIPQIGFDHFFWDPELFLKVVALIQVIAKTKHQLGF